MAQYDERAKAYVSQLIQQEMQTMDNRKDDIKPCQINFPVSTFIATEYARLEDMMNGSQNETDTSLAEAYTTPFSMERYQLKEPPKMARHSVMSWKKALQHARLQFALQQKRFVGQCLGMSLCFFW
jgi:Breast carcinoma amplified sequence 2 (BCAS2)